jgi:hypothetical protein
MNHPFGREDGSVVCNCCWSSPARPVSGPSPAGLMTTFYCLRFETPSIWRAMSPYLYPPGAGWPGNTPRHWVCSLHWAEQSRAEQSWGPLYIASGQTQQKTPPPTVPLLLLACLPIRCLAIARISFPRERLYRAVTKSRMFLLAIDA